eukprot:m.96359 g.96359  ORF g.96359 m.96359 type:complete len:381 (-) comp15187_c0_seq4:17-1159(-)
MRLKRGRPTRLVSARAAQLQRLHHALEANPVDLRELRRLSLTKGGFVNEAMRRQIWPKLLGVDMSQAEECNQLCGEHDFEQQVILDVNRSFWRFPEGIRATRRAKLRSDLTECLNAFLAQHRSLCYYQGLHEIAAVFMLTSDQRSAHALLRTLAACHIADFLSPTMRPVTDLLEFLFPLIQTQDDELYQFLRRSGVLPHFCLSWVLTWFTHVVDSLPTVQRIFDACLSSHPLFPLYMAAALVVQRRDDVLQTTCEYSAVYQCLNNVPPNLDFEACIASAGRLIEEVPPKRLCMSGAAGHAIEQLVCVRSFAAFQKAVEARNLAADLEPILPGSLTRPGVWETVGKTSAARVAKVLAVVGASVLSTLVVFYGDALTQGLTA